MITRLAHMGVNVILKLMSYCVKIQTLRNDFLIDWVGSVKRLPLAIFLIVPALNLAPGPASGNDNSSAGSCAVIWMGFTLPQPLVERWNEAPPSLALYREMAQRRVIERGYRLPDSFSLEVPRIELWAERDVPNLIAHLLPQGIYPQAGPLIAPAGADLVKTQGGSYVSVRAEWLTQRVAPDGVLEDHLIGATVGVRVHALVDNLGKPVEQRSLVSHDAKAVILHFGGGGTRTTGPHAGKDIQEYFAHYGLDVITIENPEHGFGPYGLRSAQEVAKAYFEFIKKYLAGAGKPIFLSGHSLGGEMVDVFMRLFKASDLARDPALGLIRGLISLSTIPQLTPNADFEQRLEELDSLYDVFQRPDSGVSEYDRGMVEGLLTNNKIAPRGNYSESMFSSINSWDPSPFDGDRLPTLFIWGEGDFLVAGRLEAVEERLKHMPWVRVLTYRGDRWNELDQKYVRVGHQIFEHFRAGYKPKEQLQAGEVFREGIRETYHDMLDFMDAVLRGVSLTEVGSARYQNQNFAERLKRNNPEGATLRAVVQSFFNNLTFREFAKNFELIQRVSIDPERTKALSADVELHNALLTFERLKANREAIALREQNARARGESPSAVNRQDLPFPEIDENKAKRFGNFSQERLNELRTRLQQEHSLQSDLDWHEFLAARVAMLEGLRRGYHIPLGDQKGEALEHARKRLAEEINSLKVKSDGVRTVDIVRQELESQQTKLRRREKDLNVRLASLELDQLDAVAEVRSAREHLNGLISDARSLIQQMDLLGTKHYREYMRRTGGLIIEQNPPGFPPGYEALMRAYGEAQERLQSAKTDLAQVTFSAAASGAYGEEIQSLAMGTIELRQAVRELEAEFNQLETRLRAAERRLMEVQGILWERYSHGYYRVERYTLWELLNRPLSQGLENSELLSWIDDSLRILWTKWNELWRDKPPETSRTELY